MTDRPTWKDRYPDHVTCVRCLEVRDTEDLDRLLWCEDCREIASARAMDIGWWIGGAVALVLVGYVWTQVEPSRSWMGAWIGSIAAAFYLAARLSKEIIYGYHRMVNSRAVEAVPPSLDEFEDTPPDHDPDPGADPGPDKDDGPPRVNLRGR